MEESYILSLVLSILTLLTFATITAYLLRKSKFPYTVALLFVGIIVGFLGEHVQSFSFFSGFTFSPEVVFYFFLPTLIFESAFHMDLRQFRQSLRTITLLASLGLMINAAIVTTAMYYLLGIPFIISLLFGLLISPTDPISVISVFKRVGAPQRLRTLVEGESLTNDGIAIVLFNLVLGFVVAQETVAIHWSGVAQSVLLNIFGGVCVGLLLGFIFSKALDYIKNSKEIEISITLILAHSTFLVATHFFHVSGILATVAAGLVIGNYGAHKISPAVKDAMVHFWDYMSFIANSLLFLITGTVMWGIRDQILPLWDSILLVIGVVVFARALMMYTFVPTLNVLFPKDKIPFHWVHIMQWSGITGSLTIALALTLPTDLPYYDEILIYAGSVIFFTMVFNGLTVEPLLSKLGLKKFSLSEKFEYDEVKVLIDKRVTHKFDMMFAKGFIQQDIYEKAKELFEKDAADRLQHFYTLVAQTENAVGKNQLKELLKRHLFGVERRIYNKLYFYGEITQDLLTILLQTLDEQLEQGVEKRIRLGRLSLFNPDGILIQSLQKIGFHTLSSSMKKKEVMLRYEMYRARIIGSAYVLNEIERFRETQMFTDEALLDMFTDRYCTWNQNARTKLELLEQKDGLAFDDIRLYLAQKVANKIEVYSIEEFYKYGIISDKVRSKLMTDMTTRYSQDLL